MFNNKWLNPTLKQNRLRSLNYAIAAAERDDKSAEPVDLKFVPYLKRINRISWVATNQCCTGHFRSFELDEFFKWIWHWKVWNPWHIWGYLKDYGYGSGWDHHGHLAFDVEKKYFLEVLELIRKMYELGKFEDIWISGKPGETAIGNFCVWFHRVDFPYVVEQLIEELEKMDGRINGL